LEKSAIFILISCCGLNTDVESKKVILRQISLSSHYSYMKPILVFATKVGLEFCSKICSLLHSNPQCVFSCSREKSVCSSVYPVYICFYVEFKLLRRVCPKSWLFVFSRDTTWHEWETSCVHYNLEPLRV